MTALAPHPQGGTLDTVLIVPGMHCAGCMGKVERALQALDGVASARVNLSARQVAVAHDPGLTTPQMVDALAAAGFPSQPRGEDLAPPASAVKPLLAPLAVAGFACMNVMLLSVSIWSGAQGPTRDLFHWLSALIGVPAIAYSGRPFFASAWSALRHWRTNMDVPISIGVILATGLSLFETVSRGSETWFDGTLMLLLFLLSGRALDAAMRDKARAGVDALLRQAAPGALVIAPQGDLNWLTARELAPGMVMRVAAGERLAADGEIVAGSSLFDQSLLTGESAPVVAATGEAVLAGTLNLERPVDVRVSAAGEGTTLAEIARLMDAAGQGRSGYVRLADRASRIYAPAVHTLALASFIGWLMAGAGIYHALVIAIAVLVITCPCALGLAVPVAQVVASGTLMRAGIMVKDGSALERLSRIDRALLDKTGSLTIGHPVPDPDALAALPGDAAEIAVALASHSRHPIARALAEALGAMGHKPAQLEDVHEQAGRGVMARWKGIPVRLARPKSATGMATELDITVHAPWVIPFADQLRPNANSALHRLEVMGIECSILSGDSAAAVAETARAVGLAGRACARPEDKLAAIRKLQGKGYRVLMVGDGLNDGPALAAADASIAPGSASDVGRQAADVVFLGESLLALPRVVQVARGTMRVVRQNFALAIGYNVLAVPLAIMGHVTPLLAAAAMSGSSLFVIANSLRLARMPRWKPAR